MTLAGHDLSNNNGPQYLSTVRTSDFTIFKVTEGLSYRDTFYKEGSQVCRDSGKCCGGYEFVWPTFDPEDSADNFCAAADFQPGDLPCIDFEPATVRSKLPRWEPAEWPSWIVANSNRIHANTGTYPAIYMNPYTIQTVLRYATDAETTAIHNLPLWIAYWPNTNNPHLNMLPGLYGWPVVTLWQWNGIDIDKDLFYGTVGTWLKLAVPGHQPPPPPNGPSLTVDGYFGPHTIKATQAALNVAVDGIVGPVTRKALQRRVGARPVDGIVGLETSYKVKKYVHFPHVETGQWASIVGTSVHPHVHSPTTAYLQRALNEGKF